jgi:hypothetical protein
MGITLNGTTSKGELTGIGPIVSAYPYSLLVWVKPTSGGTNQIAVYHGDSSKTEDTEFYVSSTSGKMRGNAGTGGTSNTCDGNDNIDTANWKLAIYSCTSATARRVYYYTTAGVPDDTVNVTPVFANFDRIIVGARPSTSLPFAGDIAEVHLFSVALSTTDYSNLSADSVKPEAVTGWVDGWKLLTATDLTSIGGTRTLTATSLTTSGTHPIARSAGGTSLQESEWHPMESQTNSLTVSVW